MKYLFFISAYDANQELEIRDFHQIKKQIRKPMVFRF
jgi:hypothetical protein